jgi:trans-aconitate methyltransferase
MTGTNWDARRYDDRHAFVWQQAAGLLELLAPRAGERILDLGCGTGHLTAQIAAAGADVVGLDLTPTMIEEAKCNYPQLGFIVGDARDFAFDKPFDAVLSNATLHWVKPPEKVITCLRRALKPGGRFVAEFGGRGNVRAIVDALSRGSVALGLGEWPMPWYFPGISEYTGLLEAGGFETTFATLFDRPTPLQGEDGMRQWVAMFAGGLLDAVPAERREQFLSLVETRLRATLYRDDGWFADYRRLRVVAVRTDRG